MIQSPRSPAKILLFLLISTHRISNWENLSVPPNPNYSMTLNNTRLEFVSANFLIQMTDKPTRSDNTLYLTLTLVNVLCIGVRYFMSILVLQSSWWGRESWLLCLICLPGVSWWLSGSSSQCFGVVCSLWLWYFLIILTYYFWCQNPTTAVYHEIRCRESQPGASCLGKRLRSDRW